MALTLPECRNHINISGINNIEDATICNAGKHGLNNVRRSPAIKTIEIAQDVHMPLFGLGTSRNVDEDVLFTTLDVALACGYRLIDTASRYNNEAFIGSTLQELLPKYALERSDMFITTKLQREDMGVTSTRQALVDSLNRLNLDYVDLFLIHHPRPEWYEDSDPRNAVVRRETWLELEKLQREGLCRAIGVSNYEIRHMQEMLSYATIMPAVNQSEFHPHLNRGLMLEYCRQHGITFQAFTSLGQAHPDLLGDPVVNEVAAKYGTDSSQVLLAWAYCQDVGVIPKSVTPHRIRQNIQAVQVELDRADIDLLWQLNRDTPYSNSRCRPWLVT